MLLEAAIGAFAATTWLGFQSATPHASSDLELEPQRVRDCAVSIVLVSSDGSSVSSTIDRVSGGLGFSHAYLDPCAVFDDGRRAVIDYQPGHGVHWSDGERYASRRTARLELDRDLGEQLFGCVRSRIGQPFNVATLLTGQPSAAQCCGLLVSCLPWSIRRRLAVSGRSVAPNDLARLYNVRAGQTVRIEGS